MVVSEVHRRDYSKQPSKDPKKVIDTQRGRFALAWLIDQDGTAELDTWATHLSAWEEDVPLCEVTEDRWMHYYSWLYFALLPRLVQEDLVEHYHGMVWPVDDVDELGEYLLELSTDEE